MAASRDATRTARALNGSLTIIVLTPLTTFSRGRSGRITQVYVFVGVFPIVRAGPATGRNSRARVFRAALPCLALIALIGNRSERPNRHAGPVQPDAHQPGDVAGFAAAPDRGGGERSAQQPEAARTATRDKPAPSRIGQIPKYGLPAASGAADSGYDSLNRKRKKPKFYPGQARPKPPVGPGSPPPPIASNTAAAAVDSAVAIRQQDAAPAGDGRHGGGPAAAQAAQGRRRSVRRGRRLRRQLPDQVRGRTLRRLRHQSRPARAAQGIAVLRDRAGISRGLRLGAPRAGRRPARLLHRLRQQPPAERRRHAVCRRRSISTGRISSAMSTAGSTSAATPG